MMVLSPDVPPPQACGTLTIPDRGRSQGMDGLQGFLEAVREHDLVAGHLRGLLHIAIGRKLTTATGDVVSTGATWRELAALLKLLRFDRELVRELGADPDELSPRDRTRFWYSAIAAARPDTPEAVAQAEKLIPALHALGYVVGPSPGLPVPPLKPIHPPRDVGHSKKKKK